MSSISTGLLRLLKLLSMASGLSPSSLIGARDTKGLAETEAPPAPEGTGGIRAESQLLEVSGRLG